MRVLVFGASSVQGFWDSQGGWADRLKNYYDHLQIQDFSVEQPHVMNLGISGENSRGLIGRVEQEAEARQNIKGLAFVVQIGTNNSAIENGRHRSSIEDYQKDLEKIIRKCQRFSDKVLVVGFQAVNQKLTTPVAWKASLHFENESIYNYEQAAQKVCQDLGVVFIPIFKEFQAKKEAGKQLNAHDGLHPNDAGHELIFSLVQPKLDEVLST